MSTSKKKTSKSNKKQSSNIQITPPPNPTPVYRPEMFLEDPMFSPTQMLNQTYMGPAPTFYTLPQFPGHYFTTPSPMQSQTQTPTPPESQVAETQFPSTQPRRLLQSDSEEDEEEEEQQEEEAAEEEPSVRGKGKARAKPIAWTTEEVKALAYTWIDISEDPSQGNDQDVKVFQDRIWKKWCMRMGRVYRTGAQLYSKWRNVSKIAKEFESIFYQAERNWPSGANVDDVMASARVLYQAKNGTRNPFNVAAETFWRAIRLNEKWKAQKSFHEFAINPKRARTSASTHSQSSDASVRFDMNAEPEDVPLPMGRDRAKRKMKAGSTSTTSSQTSEDIKLRTEKIDNLKSIEANKDRRSLLEIASRPISHLTGIDYQISLEAKKEAARKLGFHFDEN